MNIILSQGSNIPLYEQITEQIRQQILNGTLPNQTALPSIRLLAKELKVSIITTKRAYEELEQQGFVQTQPGKGTYVSIQNLDVLKDATVQRIEDKLLLIITEAKAMGLSKEDLTILLTTLYEEA